MHVNAIALHHGTSNRLSVCCVDYSSTSKGKCQNFVPMALSIFIFVPIEQWEALRQSMWRKTENRFGCFCQFDCNCFLTRLILFVLFIHSLWMGSILVHGVPYAVKYAHVCIVRKCFSMHLFNGQFVDLNDFSWVVHCFNVNLLLWPIWNRIEFDVVKILEESIDCRKQCVICDLFFSRITK